MGATQNPRTTTGRSETDATPKKAARHSTPATRENVSGSKNHVELPGVRIEIGSSPHGSPVARASELGAAYENAWQEWAQSGDA